MLEFAPMTCRKILEVDCGEGIFGEALIRRQNAEVWGVEPNAVEVDKAMKRLSRVINGEFGEPSALPKAYFDCIIFNCVLQHMYDPWNALAFAGTLLNSPEAVVVASIPNFRYWHNMVEIIIQKEWTYKDEGTLDRTHVHFFCIRERKIFVQLGRVENSYNSGHQSYRIQEIKTP
jgi:2-polyprenyl-3-methyl-5-hydroxy-6-metoxy-1,4-benzoquinol methylase